MNAKKMCYGPLISILVIKVFSKYLLMTALVEKEHERGIINSMNVIKQYSTMAVSCRKYICIYLIFLYLDIIL